MALLQFAHTTPLQLTAIKSSPIARYPPPKNNATRYSIFSLGSGPPTNPLFSLGLTLIEKPHS